MSQDGIEIRTVRPEELPALLELYRHLHRDDLEPESQERLQSSWRELLEDRKVSCFVGAREGLLISSCSLIVVPNLTRGARPYGLIENVVTRSEHRGRGFGFAVLRHALARARELDCYKVMLMTGTKNEPAHHFYRKVGFRSDLKTGFVVAMP